MSVSIITPNGTSVSAVSPPSSGGATSSSNIGELNAPAWKSPFSGAWGTVGEGTEKEVILSYPSSSGTAGFVSLECTGDTDSFQLTEVEGEDIGTPQTFAALTNSHDLMYIAFKGTASGSDMAISIKVLPIYNGGAAKTMTIKAIDHEGTEAGTITASATVANSLLVPTSISDFTGIAARVGPTVMTTWATSPKVGIVKTQLQGGWGNVAGVGSYCRIDKVITSGASGYVQHTPSSTGDHMIMGLGYLSDYTFTIPSNTTANYAPMAARWGAYCWGAGGAIAAGDFETSTPVVFTPAAYNQGILTQAGRTIRLEWASNVVTLKYSDDAFASHSATIWTFAQQIDTVANGNMVVSFANHDAAQYNAGSVFENIKLYGTLA